MQFLFVEAKRRIVSLHSCGEALLNIYLPKHVPCVVVTYVAAPCLTVPPIAHSKLYEMCMFHATRKHGPRKHVMGMHCRFLVAPQVDT